MYTDILFKTRKLFLYLAKKIQKLTLYNTVLSILKVLFFLLSPCFGCDGPREREIGRCANVREGVSEDFCYTDIGPN